MKISIFAACLSLVLATEDQCHADCRSSDRPVGPTRPWASRPHPYHVVDSRNANDYDFPAFCVLGCTFFFREDKKSTDSHSDRSSVDRCLDSCDDQFNFNSSIPPYNDLIEMARLECIDGCNMALARCQPGYYCLQVGGEMIPCPAGTYRDVSYDAVTECIPCPPNYYREDIKGRSLSACSPCPSGTSAIDAGSTSIKDCARCPAGTFSTEASFCQCITPQACADEPLASPADAEKKDTVPYIGRW